MKSETRCPLCGEKLEKENGFSYLFYCTNKDCFMHCTYEVEGFNLLESQIARIKQEAKQELMSELEEYLDPEDFWYDDKVKYSEIKKKHGVE